MLKHVLVPLDGSQLAEKALDMARRVLAPDGKLTILTSVQQPTPPVYAYPSAEVLDEIIHDREQIEHGDSRAQQYLDHVTTNLKLNGLLNVETEITTGNPAEVIIERAYRLGVEAIVMSTHGRSGLSRLLFGSITLKVLSDTPCPVIVVPAREQERVAEEAPTLGFDALAAE